MPEVISEALPLASVGVLAGPSFAKELALDMPTGVTLAFRNEALASAVATALSTPRFRVYTCDDPISATIGGAFKNVLAIACGIAVARDLGEDARALLIARGLYEMGCIVRAKGGNPLNLLGLAGSGDVTLTCMGTQSRNTTFGMELGRGRSVTDILAERKVVTEGVQTAASLNELAQRLKVEAPIVRAVNEIVNRAAPIDQTIEWLLSQPTQRELADLV
jgi:glycerol-3-phosphate dehydrogenase (NAD(P)+)